MHLLAPVYWNAVSQTSELASKVHGVCIEKAWQLFRGQQMTMFYLEEDWQRTGVFLLKRVLKESGYIKEICSLQHEAGLELAELSNRFYSESLSGKGLKELFGMLKELRAAWLKHDGLNVLPWFVLGDFLSDYLQLQLKGVFPNLSVEDFHVLSSPGKRSFTANEELEVLVLAISVQSSGDKEILEKNPAEAAFEKLSETTKSGILGLVQKYYWIPFGYDGPSVWGKEHYTAHLKEIVSQDAAALRQKISSLESFEKGLAGKQAALVEKIGINHELRCLLQDLRTLAMMTDERKEFTFQAHVAFHRILKEAGSSLGLPLPAVRSVTLEELFALASWPEKISEIAGRRANCLFIVFGEKGACRIIEGSEAERIAQDFLISQATVEEITGSIASRGSKAITKGVARVLASTKDVGKIHEGEILIAPMTTPDFVVAMRKAAAIVTDEGGVTCHAAIISRELGILCIIGTKVATKVLKDGDMVLVDTEKGLVKKLVVGK